MKTKIQQLKQDHPGLEYFAGDLYATHESEEPIEVNADQLILDHYFETLRVGQTGLSIEQALEAEFDLDFTGLYKEESFKEAFNNI